MRTICERYKGGLNPFDVFFYGAGGWTPARIQAEMVAQRWQDRQQERMRDAARMAAEGREVFLVDQADEEWDFD